MLDKFHDIIGGIHVPVDDGVDKLNRKYTLLVFLFLALPIFTKQYIGDPIECFAPVYFAEHQSRYINSYCWTQSTYYMVPVGDPDDDGDQQEPPDRITPDELDYFISFETVTHIGNERLRRVRVSYYQWAPLILLAQGLCFYIPFLIWNSCANNAGVKLRRLLKKASDIASLPPGCQQREALLAEFVDQFHTLVMGEAGWCADLQCGGLGAGSQLGAPAGTLSNSSAGSSASNSSAGSQGGHAHQHHHHHHHHHHQANGAAGAQAGGRGNARGPAAAQAASSTGPAGSEHHHHQAHGSSSNSGAGCCLMGIPLLGSLISCCLRPCASFGLVGPSRYLCLLYLAVKFAYVFNVGLQFFLLGKFLGRGYLRHGLELINRVLLNGEWWASPRFPLSTLCQVRADMSGGLRSYTCQCVLPINVFNEKIFSVVWFYMAFLLPLNVLSLLFWIYRTFESNRMSYIRLCLWRTRLVELNQIHRTVRRLSQSYLGWDGVFLLRLIEHNHGSIMATLIMSRLWEFYANQIKLQEDANQIALANNAHNTLSNLTTTQAIAAGHQQHPHPPPPPAPQPQQQQQQQYLTNQAHSHANPAAGGHAHHAHAQPGHAHHHNAAGHHHQMGGAGPGGAHHGHAPHGHSMHGPHGFAAHGPGPHPPLQPTQMGGQFAAGTVSAGGPHPPPPPPMVPHGPAGKQGHHSGQVSQGPGHHPLHAANTAAAAHHVHHATLAAGPQLSGAFTGAHANLLAQLHHQATSNQQQQQQANNQQQPPGNVAAAVAALAAAAAATNNQPPAATPAQTGAPTQSASQSQEATSSTSGPASAASAGPNGSTIHLNGIKQPSQAPNGGPTSGQGATAGPGATSTSSATTSFITAGNGPPLPPPPPAHVVAAVAAASGTTPSSTATSRLVTGGPTNPANPKGAGPAPQQSTGAPAPPPHTNPNLFNLKPSSLQQATGQTGSPSGASPGGPAGSARFAAAHAAPAKRT